MGETVLIQNTVENDHSEAATDSSDVLQSEVPSEAGDRTDEVLTSITSLLSANEEMQLPPNINLQT
ncbi:hypothetical protein RMCBS344292_17406 [Rhizopus microsporus]|nr:hypothetical protein RMCBS344292_17406 [Rhizopus microsporus]